MRRPALVVASLATASLLSSCGSSGPGLSTKASTELNGQVQAVRAAAVGHDRTGAAAQLSQLRLQVTQLEQQGQISPTKAQAILDAVAAVQGQLASIPIPPPPPTTAPSPPSTVKPPPPPSKDHHGHGGDNTQGGGDRGGGGD